MAKKLIGVRTIVEFELKSGSIDQRTTSSEHSALEGTRIHQMLQKRAPKNYDKEVRLQLPYTLSNGTEITIDGRADGIFRDAKTKAYTIDEIKTSETLFAQLEPGTLALYWGQVKFYGYLFLATHPDLDSITLQLTYYQTLDKDITRTQQTYTRAELEAFALPIIADYAGWLVFEANWQAKRQQAAQQLKFPFPAFRNQQRSLATSVYKTILTNQTLLVEAPTGTGKTMATLFPTVKAMGESEINRIFYLTAKQSTRHVAEKALVKMATKGAQLKAVTLTAKDKICFMDERICTPEHCPFAKGYFDRRKTGLKDILDHENQLDRPTIEQYARQHQLCPFEFALDASLFCDVVICDYNYLFDPLVYLQRFFADKAPDSVFLVDEAHNLVERARSMYSTALTDGEIAPILAELAALPHLKKLDKKLQKSLNQILDAFTTLTVNQKQPLTQPDPPLDLVDALGRFIERAHDWLKEQGDTLLAKAVLNFYLGAIRFTRIYDYYDDTFATEISPGTPNVVKLLCFDPAEHVAESLAKGKASVLFSATLSPMPYYQEVFGNTESLVYRLASPFPVAHQRILIPTYIKTTYQARQQNLPKIVAGIHTLISGQTGNYLVFCPSYALLQQVAADFKAAHPQVATIEQQSNMPEAARQAFLGAFQDAPAKTLVGFAILGGIFSEGIDLVGQRLIGVAVVTVGLPGLSLEKNTLQQYFDAKNHQGFAYAYQLPGMNHVLQAAGRLIRQVNDRGIVLLLDQRFLNPSYQQYFPAHWPAQIQVIHNPGELQQAVTTFWQQPAKADHEPA
ncbi:DNA helicase [Agrilactobacillus composti DSM 18527 = JCM 14202]|uniref:DNA helicase n=1 Tax=Agrilactobacillus composti DSM 18527 = JCM 14202 TaxID=1423734 RepID=X0PWG5_9LACO|nr:ATP-dependent DNA helicase [Agrilactobacillus composti]KRM32918.1 DNA helicase [Agrilactobacillus composti DSM 18527 = JCM 14202]GAF41916.1 DinG family ATP-dependent helicase [Agrilactobacillus composti DSM 18527 = JCM 14202]